jgi:hypothetical protein
MFAFGLLLLSFYTVNAFQGMSTRSACSSMTMLFNLGDKKVEAMSADGNLAGLVGSDVEAPNWDPLNLADQVSDETLQWYRAAELKHARICMLAALGLSVQPVFHLPDPVFDSDLGYGVVTKLYAERPEAIWQILLAIAAIETNTLFSNGQGEGGNLGWDPLNLQTKLTPTNEQKEEMQLRELKNGRLAMLGTSALLIQEFVTGYGPYEQLMKH